MDKEKKEYLWNRYKYRIITVIIALVFALITLIFGFAEAVLTALIVGIGYCVGAYLDGDLDIRKFK